jgi:hypothetical protein
MSRQSSLPKDDTLRMAQARREREREREHLQKNINAKSDQLKFNKTYPLRWS